MALSNEDRVPTGINLDQSYQNHNGKFKLAAYSEAVLRALQNFWLTEEEKEVLFATNEDFYIKLSRNNHLKTTMLN